MSFDGRGHDQSRGRTSGNADPGDPLRDRLLAIYRRVRVPGALAAFAGNLALTFAFEWTYGWLAVTAALIGIVDAVHELRRAQPRRPSSTLWIDSTLLGLTMVAIGLPAVSFAFGLWLVILATTFIVGWSRVAAYVYITAWAVAANFVTWSGDRAWTPHEVVVLDWTALLLVGALVVGLLGAALNRIREMEAEQTYMVGVVGHELGNALGAVISDAAVLERHHGTLTDGEREILASGIRAQAEESAEIADDLLTFTRVRRHTLDVRAEEIDVVAATTRAVESGSLAVRVSVPAELSAVVDPLRYRQVLRNLLINAERHGGEHIQVQIESRGRWVVVTVRDDGDGLSPDSAEIFDESPTEFPGHGLGLWISRKLTEAMGGTLTYERRDGWTAFEMTVPGAERSRATPDVDTAAR